MPAPPVLPPSTWQVVDAGEGPEVYVPLSSTRTLVPSFARSRKGDIAWKRNEGDISKLIKYWTRGEGAGLIGWGAPCDFCSCVAHLAKYVPPEKLKGFCAKLHKRATGKWPGPRSKGKHCPC
jgi:hypothetical protein